MKENNHQFIEEFIEEPIILEPEDWKTDQWKTFLDVFGLKSADRIVLDRVWFKAYGEEKSEEDLREGTRNSPNNDGIIDNRNEDEKYIDKSKRLADELSMYIDRINRLYRGINSIVIGTICISKYYAKALNEYIDIFAKDIKQLNYEIHNNIVEHITEFIKSYNPDPICCNTNKAEYSYYIDHFILDCRPGSAYYKALNMTKYKKSVIDGAEALKSSGKELGPKLYELALNLRDLELYLRSLIKQISKCEK